MPKRRHQYVSDDDDDGHGDQQPMFSQQFSQLAPEQSQSVLPERPSERNNLEKLTREDQEKYLSSLSRMILFRGLEKEPIDRLKVIKDAGIPSTARIGSAAFNEAERRIRNVFGFELARMPKFMHDMKGIPTRFKDRHYLINLIKDDEGTHSRAMHSVHEGASVEKGFILLVNALIFCKGECKANSSRKIFGSDLYRYLHKVDDAIPEEPPAQGTSRAKAGAQYRVRTKGEGLTPNVDALLEQCVNWDYFIKEKATDENAPTQNFDEGEFLYSQGPRSVMEIGRRQIVTFCASILGEEPDPSMLREIEDDVNNSEDAEDLAFMEAAEAS
mmetsp:Transcript_18357/g.45572  ORF Transcript_18357/g.45572 Transcript_18357/m.45572 type:complete len:329 (+) Transcript_18357:118-1104(+)|eukprot:CAMPEP_0116080616 /NCGR_PEP_ID=MMETSP0327-20121206/1771_1 /TAXON_ID=44447 /ORGANISM="Pseudo-nitzschia delicatissima, Strain B596" /LENGTH=328 /DNA_ID=CAMNT_0003571321 /DNA_START=70 /DNA_END=1056 /DNA_ORIENTATION=-